jgi:hypothetical protein
VGYYKAGEACDGRASNDTEQCIKCTGWEQCEEGKHFLSGECNGFFTFDTERCEECITDCGLGYYILGECKFEQMLPQTCVPCSWKSNSCDEELGTQCPGNGFEDTEECREMTPGSIAGIVIGAVFVLAILSYVVYAFGFEYLPCGRPQEKKNVELTGNPTIQDFQT